MDPAPPATFLDLNDWEVVRQFLPAGWQEQARATGALTRARGVRTAEDLLRVLLLHLGCGFSLVETASRARMAGWSQASSVALFKRLKASEEWLRWIAVGLRNRPEAVTLPEQRRMVALDATTVSEPGSTGTDWRIHYAFNLRSLQCEFFELTDVHGGESWRRFPIQAGDIWIGDRHYANGVGVAHVLLHGGDVIVRWKLRGLPLQTATTGRKLPFFAATRGLRVGEVRDLPTQLLLDQQAPQTGRLIVLRRTAAAAERGRHRAKRYAQLKHKKPSPAVMKAASYFAIWTTLPETWPARDLLEYYRLRWQIELGFKRLKSILGAGHLPKKDPASCRAWLHGKLVVSLLIERMLEAANRFSPWGYELAAEAQPVAGN